jgi:hypothetical protein
LNVPRILDRQAPAVNAAGAALPVRHGNPQIRGCLTVQAIADYRATYRPLRPMSARSRYE